MQSKSTSFTKPVMQKKVILLQTALDVGPGFTHLGILYFAILYLHAISFSQSKICNMALCGDIFLRIIF